MQFATSLLALSMSTMALALVASPLEERSIGQSCSTPDGDGSCQYTSSCTSQGFNLAGYCSGASDIQCCVKKTCSTSSGSGVCLNLSDSCSGGSFISGACPGDSSIKCCVKDSSPSSGSGTAILKAAEAEEGIPYVYGGGGCKGPSDGGFDCSGLTQYSVCKALGKTIPRTAQTQYHSTMGSRFPRSEAKPGDMIFWATGGDCTSKVAHVGIFMEPGYMVNAAHKGTNVKKEAIWTSDAAADEYICPDAVRFW